MGHYTVPSGQMLAHLYQHELERWHIRRDTWMRVWQGDPEQYEALRPRPKRVDHSHTKRASLDAIHAAFHEKHGHEVNHTHPEGYQFLHMIFENAVEGIPSYLQR